jgi:hypothetical protein
MPDLDQIVSVVKLLKDSGGWGLSIGLAGVIWYLYRSMGALLEKRNADLMMLLSEHKSVLGENRVVIDRTEQILNTVNITLEKNTDILYRAKSALEDARR